MMASIAKVGHKVNNPTSSSHNLFCLYKGKIDLYEIDIYKYIVNPLIIEEFKIICNIYISMIILHAQISFDRKL